MNNPNKKPKITLIKISNAELSVKDICKPLKYIRRCLNVSPKKTTTANKNA
ncbi:TPA: hypothetical protein KRP09_003600 [Clostridioides difficile]|nr:hypothetical protein [Clostridioides difficile]